MPINAHPAYFKAEAEYHQAETNSQKIKALKKMLATAPTHKGAQKLRGQIKKQIRNIKYRQEIEKKVGKGKSYSISKEGAAQIVIIGVPNSGKSTLLSKLSGKKVKIADYEFTTKKPEMRMIPFENQANGGSLGIWIQAIELPAINKGYHNSKHGRQMLGLLRNSDFVLVVTKNKKAKDINLIKSELEAVNIKLGAKQKYREDLTEHIPSITIDWNDFDRDDLVYEIWKLQHKIRVQTKTGGKVSPKPIVLKENSTVKDVAKTVHKDFIKNFRYAKIWGPSAKFKGEKGQIVGLNHVLADGDIVEVFTK